MSKEILLWLESAGSARLSVKHYHGEGGGVRLPSHARAQLLASHSAPCSLPHVSQSRCSSLGRVRVRGEGRAFICELFPSVVWSCRRGIRCSRRPYTGPYTWQYISAVTSKVCLYSHRMKWHDRSINKRIITSETAVVGITLHSSDYMRCFPT